MTDAGQPPTTDDPRQFLSEAVQGKSDEEIMDLVSNLGGTEPFLDMTFEGMKEALDPNAAQDCVIAYELTEGQNTYGYTVKVQDKKAETEKGAASDARVTLGLSVPDYVRLISGHLDGMQAFMQGKLKLKGDMMFAAQIQRMFNA